MALLIVLQACNALAGLAGLVLAACFVQPTWRQFVPPLYQIALRSSIAVPLHKVGFDTHIMSAPEGAFRALAWLHCLSALVRLHAAAWPKEKTGAACCQLP